MAGWGGMRHFYRRLGLISILAFYVVLAAVPTLWLGYRATLQWVQSAEDALSTRQRQLLLLLTTALERDMKGAQMTVLLPVTVSTLEASTLYDMADRFAAGLARFPYVESFFISTKRRGSQDSTYFFNRIDRAPAWDREEVSAESYPVAIRHNPAAAWAIIAPVFQDQLDAKFSVYQEEIAGTEYQTVVNLIDRSDGGYTAVGMTVDLDWARNHYFRNLAYEVQLIAREESIRLEVEDGLVGGFGSARSGDRTSKQTFPVLFADRELTNASSKGRSISQFWAEARVANDAVTALRRVSRRAFLVLGSAGVVTIVALLLAGQAIKTDSLARETQSEFVSAMSHEMKAPLAFIRLTSETLSDAPHLSETTIRDYSRLLKKKSIELTRLVENVLFYARVSDARNLSLEPVDIAELLADCLEDFKPEFVDRRLNVRTSLPAGLPTMMVDLTLMKQVFHNVLDNAIKYGPMGGTLFVSISAEQGWLTIEVTDGGQGIPSHELPLVFEKFYRGVGAKQSGSGLGLAIVQRVIAQHRGQISIRSTVGQGTSVYIRLPE